MLEDFFGGVGNFLGSVLGFGGGQQNALASGYMRNPDYNGGGDPMQIPVQQAAMQPRQDSGGDFPYVSSRDMREPSQRRDDGDPVRIGPRERRSQPAAQTPVVNELRATLAAHELAQAAYAQQADPMAAVGAPSGGYDPGVTADQRGALAASGRVPGVTEPATPQQAIQQAQQTQQDAYADPAAAAPASTAPTPSSTQAAAPAAPASAAIPRGSRIVLNPAQMAEFQTAVNATAKELGISPQVLATTMLYETKGRLDPWQKGPVTKWGEHRGLIQWGGPQARQYGVSRDSSITDQVAAAGRYLRDRGVRSGHGLLETYSAINAGGVGPKYFARSDSMVGGAPGNVYDKVNNQMAGHARIAAQLFPNALAYGAE